MSRLFWKLFGVVWLSIAGLICMLILLTNVFGLQPPQHELALRKQSFLVEIAKALLLDHNVTGVTSVKRSARSSGPSIALKVQEKDQSDCANRIDDTLNEQHVSVDNSCYLISAELLEDGPRAFAYFAIPFLVAAAASLIAAFALANYLAGPILILKDGLNALAHGDFRIRISDKFGGRQDEISNLGLDFDSTASKLQTLREIQQRLYHDVSHELRSPLSRIQAAIGVLRQSPAKLDTMMTRMDREIERLDTLVDEILTLAKLNSGYVSSFEKSRIDIIDLLGVIVDDAAFEARAKCVTVAVRSVPSFVCNINGELFCRALENVVRNAIKYTELGSNVTIDARVDDHASRKVLNIAISDEGPGVPADEIGHIFEPFQRASNSGEVAGHGLGLAIAKQSMEIQGGKILAENGPNGGLRVVIQITE